MTLNLLTKYSALLLVVFVALLFNSCDKSNDPLTVGNRVGNLAPGFSLKNNKGETVTLSDYRGQIVLVEFCASWCGYCKAEFPELNSIYEDYHNKGFEIISLSIDENHGEWIKMIDDYRLQYVCVNDPLGFNSPIVQEYGVISIPRMFLINENGEILLSTNKASVVREAISKRL